MASKITEAKGCYNASPAGGYSVSPSDSTILSPLPRALYVGSNGGNVVLTMLDGTDVTLVAVPIGTVLWLQFQKVKAATTSTGLVAFYDN